MKLNTCLQHHSQPQVNPIKVNQSSGRQHLQSAPTGTLLVLRVRTATGQRSFAVNGPATCMEPSATSTTGTGPVGERWLQAGTEDAPVLDCPADDFHSDMAIYWFSKWRLSTILELFYHHTSPPRKSLFLAEAACQISCQSDTQIWT